uniref:Proline-rich transmembrane protein 3/4 domain-containing protein n=1 Tax=Periophthalmus magnuspinnatus TaxID=409849 RepID=A0A3B4AG06_9GOBI
MASMLLFVLGLYLISLASSNAQTLIGTSSSFSSSLNQSGTSSPHPTKETIRFWPPFPTRGRSDVPIRATLRDGLSNSVQPGSRLAHPTTPSRALIKSTLNPSSGPIVNQTSITRPRTDTASLAIIRAKAKLDSTTKGTTIARPTLDGASITVATYKGLDTDLQGLGSGNAPTTKDENVPPPRTYGSGLAQYQPPVQTVPFEGTLATVVDMSTLTRLTEKSEVIKSTTTCMYYYIITTVMSLSFSGTSSFLTTGVAPGTRPRLSPTYQTAVSFRNRSYPVGRPHHPPTVNSGPFPTIVPANGTFLYWGDLSRTLAFVWELHVYGTASLFLLLFAGAALGLTLSPGANCPHHGALALANILLFVAGGIRATFFLTDPYGTRKFLPRPAVIALYNLPLHLLVWTQATMPILAMKAAGVSLFPPTLERPPLVAVLAVLQCTLLLAADLLSPALSPVVPVTLQFLSLCWGLAVCFVFLCYIFPQICCPHLPHAALPDESRRKAWTGMLAVCAVLGALCCFLHAYATLWLYGVLGEWTRFNWGWWLVHFWARLLELAWGFSLLLLASWLFWKPQRKPCRKSESNGVGKSLIRNQNQTPATTGPIKDNNRRAHSAERGVSDDSSGSQLRLQQFTRPPQRSVSGSQDIDRDTSVSLYEFDLRPPSPIDLTRSIDEALHREHLVTGGSLFHPPLSQTPSPGSGLSQGPWLRRNSDPQLSESSDATESSMPLGGSVMSSVPSRQVTAPPTPSHQGHKWAGALGSVPSSVSCPVSLRPSRTSSGRLEEDVVDDTRPFITPDSDRGRRQSTRPAGSRSYLEVCRHDDSASVSSEIIDL